MKLALAIAILLATLFSAAQAQTILPKPSPCHCPNLNEQIQVRQDELATLRYEISVLATEPVVRWLLIRNKADQATALQRDLKVLRDIRSGSDQQ